MHDMSKPVFWKKKEKYFKMPSTKIFPRMLSVSQVVT